MSPASTSFSGGTSSPPQVSPDPASSGNGPPMNSGLQAFSAEIHLKPENISPPPASHHTHQQPQHHVHGSQHGDQAAGASEVGQINQPHFDLHQDFSPPPLTPAGFVEQWEPLTPPNLLFGGAVWNSFFGITSLITFGIFIKISTYQSSLDHDQNRIQINHQPSQFIQLL